MSVRLLVIAKEPVPGLVKTRLCPPCTPVQAALVARASLEQTLATVDGSRASRRVVVSSGHIRPPHGWEVRPQRGEDLGERLCHAFADGGLGEPSLLVGMDTPQLTAHLLAEIELGLASADAVIGPAADGGWWALALRDPSAARALCFVPMSTSDTLDLTELALRRRGLRVVRGPLLRDVDTAADAHQVAHLVPDSPFAAAVRSHVPVESLATASGVPRSCS
jgi:glycosyltransferase A (GT-A) superfamily protein (DUF2064 family)